MFGCFVWNVVECCKFRVQFGLLEFFLSVLAFVCIGWVGLGWVGLGWVDEFFQFDFLLFLIFLVFEIRSMWKLEILIIENKYYGRYFNFILKECVIFYFKGIKIDML